MELTESQPCKVCGCTQLKLTDGFYFCVECGTQNTEMQETMLETTEREFVKDTFAFGKTTKIQKQKIVVEMSEEWKIWHAFNFIIANMADELIALGAPPSFKLKLLWVWTKYIQKFHKKEDFGQINRTKNKTFDAKDDVEVNSDDEDLDGQPTLKLPNCSEAYKRLRQKNIENFSLYVVYSLLYVALNLDQSDIQISDMIRWQREGRLSCKDCIKYVPEDLEVYSIRSWINFIYSLSYNKIRSVLVIHNRASALFEVLDIGSPCVPDLTALLNRFCKELCLPKELRQLALSILDQFVFPANRNFLNNLLPNYDVAVMSCIVVAIKMCFGLDDHYDLKLSFYVDEINDEHKHLNAYRIGVSEPTERHFNIRDWLTFLEYRKQILAKYYYPMSYVYQIGLKEPLGSEALKDHVTLNKGARSPWVKKRALEKVQTDILTTIPLRGAYPIIPKENFPASLTPLTAYTVVLVQKIQDPQERLILTEDFSKYNLKYACEDLCLKSSEADDNIITGVSDEYKNVTKKLEILDVPQYPKYPEIYVIDYEYDDWVKDYRDAEKEIEQTEAEIKQELKNEIMEEGEIVEKEEKPDPNMLEEMVENGNIFACFDSPYDMASVSSTTINNANSIGEEYGHTFPEEPSLMEAFDPLYFNREEMTRMLVLDACYKYKIPIPREYRESKYVPNRKRNTDEAKVKQVHHHQISVADILNTYKSFVQEEDPPPNPVTLTEDANSVENNDQAMDSILENNNNEENNLNGDVDFGDDNEGINLDNDTHVQKNDVQNEQMEIDTLDDSIQVIDNEVTNIENADEEMHQELPEKVKTEKKTYKRKGWDLKKEDVEKIKGKKQKNMNDRSYFEPLIKKNIDNLIFKYYIKYLHYNGIKVQGKIEELILDTLPNSYRVVLQHCAAIIEHPTCTLLEGVQNCEIQIFNEYSKKEIPAKDIPKTSRRFQRDSSSSEDTGDSEVDNVSESETEVNNSKSKVKKTKSRVKNSKSKVKIPKSKVKNSKSKANNSKFKQSRNIYSDTTDESNDEQPVYADSDSGDESFDDLDEEKDHAVDSKDEMVPADNSKAEQPVYADSDSGDESYDDLDEEKDHAVDSKDEMVPADNSKAEQPVYADSDSGDESDDDLDEKKDSQDEMVPADNSKA